MIKWIRRTLTRTVPLHTKHTGRKRAKQVEKYQLPPRESLVYGVALLIVFFVVLSALQALHLIVTGKFNSEMWGGMLMLIGVLVGAFFGGRA